jgi:iron complex outermembrane receptor protein
VLPLQSASLILQTRARHQSETLVGLDFLPEQQQPGYWTVDASLTLTTADKRFSVSAFGQNLTDRTVMSNTFVVPFSTFTVGALRPPRTLGVRLIGSF